MEKRRSGEKRNLRGRGRFAYHCSVPFLGGAECTLLPNSQLNLMPLPSHTGVPSVVTAAGTKATRRYIEFFTAEIRNPRTRRAYAGAVGKFFAWCQRHQLTLESVEPVHVAAFVEQLSRTLAAPSVKQNLAAVRMLYDWLVIGQVVPMNPAASVRGPKHGSVIAIFKWVRPDNRSDETTRECLAR